MAKRFGNNFKAVIPRPSKGVPDDLRQVNIGYLNYSKSSRKPLGWIEARLIGCIRLQSFITEFRPELIVIRPGALSLPQFLSTLRKHIPFAIKTAGIGSFEAFYKHSPLRRLFSGLNECLFLKLLNNCVAVDVASDMQRELLTNLYPQVSDRAFVIDNGVDLEIFSTGDGRAVRQKFNISEADVVIGYVGNFPMSRGGKEVVDLVNYLHRSMPAKGIIVGDSGEADQCRHYVHELGLSDLITVTGQVEFEYVPDVINAMDIGLSILTPEKRHASEQKVRQYLASGLCVIGTQGSNDFLKSYDFARVVSGVNISEIYDAAFSLLNEGRSGLNKRASQAKQFARNELSIESKNDYRLEVWSKYLAKR
jgi:glycosyltransferase involved in cell wall biosynthesis